MLQPGDCWPLWFMIQYGCWCYMPDFCTGLIYFVPPDLTLFYHPVLFSCWNSRPSLFSWQRQLDFLYNFPSQEFQIIMEGTDIVWKQSDGRWSRPARVSLQLGELVCLKIEILISEYHLRRLGQTQSFWRNLANLTRLILKPGSSMA